LIHPDLQKTFHIQAALTAPFEEPLCGGRVFLLDRRIRINGNLLLTNVAATRIGIELDHYLLRKQLSAAAVAAERASVARDLHDGILQGLAAANIQLKVSADSAPPELKDKIARTRELLSDEQRRLRAFITQTRSERPKSVGSVELATPLQQHLSRLAAEWGCNVECKVNPEDLQVAPVLAQHLRHMLGEALSNAVRHGGASMMVCSVLRCGDGLRVTVQDNGRGFPSLSGTYDNVDLAAQDLGPLSLRTRVNDLGGVMWLTTSTSGTEITIELPA